MSLEESAVNFFKATKGFGTDEDLIIKEVCDHKNVERQEIKRIYLKKYKKRLEDALKSELSGNFLKGVLMLMTPSANLEAQILHDAMKGLGTDKDLLIDFLCSKTGSELQTLTYAFQNLYGKTLKSWVKADTSGDLGKLLDQLASSERDDNSKVDAELAEKDAEALYQAGEKRWGTDEDRFIDILTKRNFAQLNETFKQYKKKSGKDIEASIESEMSGDLAKALITIGNIYLFVMHSYFNPELSKLHYYSIKIVYLVKFD